MLDRLAAWKSRYGERDTSKLERLLDAIAKQVDANVGQPILAAAGFQPAVRAARKSRLKAGRRQDCLPHDLIRLHETLLFLCAYPHSPGVARRARTILATFAKRVTGLDPTAFQEPEVSGIAGTSLTAVFSYEVARRLTERHPNLRIDWEAYDTPDRLGPVLRRFIPLLDEEWPVEAHTPFQQWMEAAMPGGSNDLQWLLAKISGLGLPERDCADLYESMQLPLYWELKDAEHTRSKIYQPGQPLYCHREPLLRRKDVSLRDAFEAPALPVHRVAKAEAARILEIILDTSAIRYRELYGFTHPDSAHVYHIRAGRGLEIYFFGIPPAWRLPLRAYHAGMFFKNGVPGGYIEVLSLFDRADVGFNLYYTFREGESAWIYARLVQLIHQMLGVNSIFVDPYQIGDDNDEALDSGAFWFYRKLGFEPVDPEIARLLEREERRIARNPAYRSTRATLKKLAAGYIRFEGPQGEPGAWNHFHVRNIGFAAQRTGARALLPPDIVKAKQGPEESSYLHLMQKDKRLRNAVSLVGRTPWSARDALVPLHS